MKKFKRRLSLTLRGSQTIDESLSELAEQMTVEENSSKDNEPIVRNGRPPTSHSMHSFLHQYTSSFKKPPLRRPHSVIGGSLSSFMPMTRNGSRLEKKKDFGFTGLYVPVYTCLHNSVQWNCVCLQHSSWMQAQSAGRCVRASIEYKAAYESKKRISADESMKQAYFKSLGTRVHTLPESVSIFTLKEIQLQKDPGFRSSSYPETGNGKAP
ncbi:UNVERIFIED_CONTAM: hypothetical protein FKN15_036742 [Acipenser sinensis]